jgi:Na+/proline symporter
MLASDSGSSYLSLQKEWNEEQVRRQEVYMDFLSGKSKVVEQSNLNQSNINEKKIRHETRILIENTLPEAESNDRDYVFIRFILDYLPKGIIGLLISMILAAGMSSTASELNALASTTTVDFYKRLIRKTGNDKHYVLASKTFVLVWGAIAIGLAFYGSLFENLIQFVNIVGSLFYGTILGIFLVAFFLKYVSGFSVFLAALISESIVLILFMKSDIGYLWYNAIGCSAVIIFGLLLELLRNHSRNKT